MFRQKEDDHLEMDVAREKRYSLHMPKTPSFIPGQRCPQNLEISIITDVQFSNFNNSEVVKDINELPSYSENLVF